jgi:hypothetical protein
MPRAVDLRQPEADYDPNRSGTEFHLVGFQQYAQILADIIEQFSANIIANLVDMIKNLTGIDLSAFADIFGAFDFSSPEAFLESLIQALIALPGALLSLLGPLTAPLQGIIDLLLGGLGALTGGLLGGGTGAGAATDPISALFGLVTQVLQAPFQLLGLLFGQQATTQAQTQALGSSGFIHDFASQAVSGWTNLTGTLALSSRGNYIQAPNVTVAYRASGVANDKYGAHIVVNPSMQGACRVGICATSTASNYAGLEVYRGFDGDALRLVTGASPTLTVVQKQADFIGVNRLGLSSLDVRTDGVNKFTVLRDGQPVPALDWTDTGGIVTHGASNRNVVLASNNFDRNEDSFYGPAINKVVSYGW